MRTVKSLLISVVLILLISACGSGINMAGGLPSYHGKDKWKYHKSSGTNYGRKSRPTKFKNFKYKIFH